MSQPTPDSQRPLEGVTPLPPRSSNPSATPPPISSLQVWSQLTPEQQQAVRQAFIQVCRSLMEAAAVPPATPPTAEANHERA